MAKKSNLAAALAANKSEPEAAEVREVQTQDKLHPQSKAPSKRASSREGQVNISAWFDMPVRYTLDELCLKRKRELGRRVTTQELLGEALNDLFKKYGLPEVAPTEKQD